LRRREPPPIPFCYRDEKKMATELTETEIHLLAQEILQLPDQRGWSVVDRVGSLALVHYDEDADMKLLGHLRGVLLDLEQKVVVAGSFGYTATAVAEELTPDSEGNLTLTDEIGDTHQFLTATTVIKPIFEGVVIRVIWWGGRSYHFTHRKIEPVRSRWGSSPSFLTMYEEAGGPTDGELFDTAHPYSTTCYFFLVCHPALLVGTRQRVETPYLLYLARQETVLEQEALPGEESFFLTPTLSGRVAAPCIHKPTHFSLAQANHHLQYGYYDPFTPEDPRMATGEAVILFSHNERGPHLLKVHSPSYQWRLSVRGNNPNLPNQFYSLLDWVAKADWERMGRRLLLLPPFSVKEIEELWHEQRGITALPCSEFNIEQYPDRDSRIHLLWLNFLFSLPPLAQPQALELLKRLRKERTDLVQWLRRLEKDHDSVEGLEIPPRAKGIIGTARRLSRPGQVSPTIRNLVQRERGASLYGLVRDMKRTLVPPRSVSEIVPVDTPKEMGRRGSAPAS
jgi:hypothetical protein